MGLKRLLLKKGLLGGGILEGHIFDAIDKKKKTGKSFKKCLEESIKETFTEDLPGTSHIYERGLKEGKEEGTIEQSVRDERKIRTMQQAHDEERDNWLEIDKSKDRLIEKLSNNNS